MNAGLLKRFMADDRGVATIESLLWFPLFVYLLVLITDVSFIFYGKAQALRIVQDGNRAFSIRHPSAATRAQAEAFIEANLHRFDPTAKATVAYDITTGLIRTTATISASELMAVGSIPGFGDFTLEIVAHHFQEQ